MTKRLVISMLIGCLILPAAVRSEEGSARGSQSYTTVITHGFQPFADNSPPWAWAMAEQIALRMGNATAYLYDPATGNWEFLTGTGSTQSVVLVFDWARESDGLDFAELTTWKYAQAAGDALYAALRDPAGQLQNVDVLTNRTIHMIGHSRGCTVNSEVMRLLSLAGYTVDQVTTLDPHPVDGTLDDGFLNWGDDTPKVWNGVSWADNYWRADLSPLDFDGISLAGYGVDVDLSLGSNDDLLSGSVGTEPPCESDLCHTGPCLVFCNLLGFGPCWFQGYSREHSDVHLWYHGTIDLAANASDGSACITDDMRNLWYANGGEGQGFSQSAVLGGQRNSNTPGTRIPPPQLPILFNGKLKVDNKVTLAGWQFHGGFVGDFALSLEPNNAFLTIGPGRTDSLIHNRFFLPTGSAQLEFRHNVLFAGQGEFLLIGLAGNTGNTYVLGSIPLSSTTPGFVTTSFPINPDLIPLEHTYRLIISNSDPNNVNALVGVDAFVISAHPTLNSTGTSLQPAQIQPGGQVTLSYRVSNPNSDPVEMFLGASITPAAGGNTISSVDCEGCGGDAFVTIPANSEQTFSRCFTVPQSAQAGAYEVCYTIRGRDGCSPGTNFDSLCKNDLTVFGPTGITIVAQTGLGGSVIPNGAVEVPSGGCQAFIATPDSGNAVDKWLLDGGVVQLGGNSYSICPEESHTLTVLFKSTAPPPPSQFAVLDPNGGETFCANDRMQIAWERIPNCDNVSIELLKGTTVDQVVKDSQPNYGRYTWRIPQDQPVGADYRISVSCLTSASTDVSDGTFEITPDCPPAEVIEIRTLNDLKLMSENWNDSQHPRNGHYLLMNDIDAGASSSWNGGNGMRPIGAPHNYFRGVFDGQGHVITELKIDWEEATEVGFFAILGDKAEVKNLTLNEIYVRGQGSVGAVAGLGGGDINNCQVTGESRIRSTQSDPMDNVGGIVGDNHRGLIRNCSISGDTEIRAYNDEVGGIVGQNGSGLIIWSWAESTDQVRGYGNRVGGIVGANFDRVEQCWSSVQRVRGVSYVGGIVGSNNGLVNDCSSKSRVEGSNNLGGISGENDNSTNRCIAIGFVENESVAGGLAGYQRSSLTDSFWDPATTTRAQATGAGNGNTVNCYGLSTALLKSMSTFTTDFNTNWDFEHIWWIPESIQNPDYPSLCGTGSPLSIPINFSASTGQAQGVVLSWDAVTYEAGCGPFYRILRADIIDGPLVAISAWMSQTSFVDDTAAPNQTYHYRVSAAATTFDYDDPYGLYEDPFDTGSDTLTARESMLSNWATGSRTEPPPNAPTGVTATDGLTDFIAVNWDPVASVSNYRVYRSESIDGPKILVCSNQSQPPCVDSSVDPDRVYFYWVTAFNAHGESEFSGAETGRMACSDDADCNDLAFCNGQESCQGGTCVQGGSPCLDAAHCDELSDSCVCLNDDDCDDGLHCNGTETCDANGVCQTGTPVNCNDGIVCTLDACNEATGSCDNIPIDALCDNGQFCDGVETCDPILDCQPGTSVNCDDDVDCTIDSCNEGTDSCDNIPDDNACTNGLWCDGLETCDAGVGCLAGTEPCIDQAHCSEELDKCICTADSECDDGLSCTTDSCNTQDFCENDVAIGSCLIADICYANDDLNPSNECEVCNSLANSNGWSPAAAGDPCGNSSESACNHADTCDGAGACLDNLEPDGSSCADEFFCDGEETCLAGECKDGVPACSAFEICDEAAEACPSDCNTNGVPDDEDLAAGTSQDVNSNGVPDDCDECLTDSDCNDGNNCTNDVCNNGECSFLPIPNCPDPPRCPNGSCSGNEDCESCPQDCGDCSDYHPADRPQTWSSDCSCGTCHDGRIEMCEAIGFLAAQLRGDHDDVSGADQAVDFWLNGETYNWDASEQDWVSNASSP